MQLTLRLCDNALFLCYKSVSFQLLTLCVIKKDVLPFIEIK